MSQKSNQDSHNDSLISFEQRKELVDRLLACSIAINNYGGLSTVIGNLPSDLVSTMPSQDVSTIRARVDNLVQACLRYGQGNSLKKLLVIVEYFEGPTVALNELKSYTKGLGIL